MSKGRSPKDFIPDYCGNVGADFELWLENLYDYLAICEVSDSDEKKHLFLNLAGLAVRCIVKGLVVPTSGYAYDAVTTAVLSHFRPASNTTSERHKFRQLRQLTDESVTSSVGRLREKAEACEFSSTSVDTVENGQVRDQLIVGVRSTEIRKELLQESQLTLASAVKKAVALEASIADSKLYDVGGQPSSSSVAAVDAVGGDSSVNRVSGTFPTRKRHPLPPTQHEQPCKYCGGFHPRGIEHCPAAKARCKSCSKIGHFTQVCQNRKYHDDNSHAVGLDPANTHLPYNGYNMAYIVTGQSTADLFTITLQVDGKPCTGLINTGATRTFLTSDIVQPRRQADRVLRAYNGGVVDTLGMADVTITSGGHVCTCSCFVVAQGSQRVLFGQDVIAELELLVAVNAVDIRPVSISVDPAAKPIAQPARRPSFSAKADIVKELERLVAADIIELVKEALAWVPLSYLCVS